MGSNETEVDINSGTVCGQDNMEVLDGGAVVGVREQEEGGRMNYEAGEAGQNTVASLIAFFESITES